MNMKKKILTRSIKTHGNQRAYLFRYAVLNLPCLQLTMYTSIVLILWFWRPFYPNRRHESGQLTGFLSYVMQIVNPDADLKCVLMLTCSLASARRIGGSFGGMSGPFGP